MAGIAHGRQGRLSIRRSSALIAVLFTLLASCGDDAPLAGADSPSPAADQAENAVLGSVNEPRPDWLPTDFPLPENARIYLVATSTTSSPKMFQLQARTLAEMDTIIADVSQWAEGRGLHPSDEGDGGNLPSTFRILSFDGVQFSPSNMQVTDEGGRYRRIILSIVGPPWE